MFIGDNGSQTEMLGKILFKIESMEAANKNLTRKIIKIEHEVKQNGEKLDEIMNHMGLPAPTTESGKYILKLPLLSSYSNKKYIAGDQFLTLIVGGSDDFSEQKSSEVVVLQDENNCTHSVPDLPIAINFQPSLILTPDQKIILCGGRPRNNEKTCWELKSNTWEFHSSLIQKRSLASAVSMKNGVFLFGGPDWEWLPRGSSQWKFGGRIKRSNPNQPGFMAGCAVKVSEDVIALIGGQDSNRNGMKKVLTYDTKNRKWRDLGNILKEGRYGHACVSFQNRIIVVGGSSGSDYLASTEIINVQDLTISTFSGNLHQARGHHGLVVAHVGTKLSVMAIGGGNREQFLDSIETWDETTGNWTKSDVRLSFPRYEFGYLSIPSHLVCS